MMRQVAIHLKHLQSGRIETFHVARDGALSWIRGFLNQNIPGESEYGVIRLEDLD